MSALLDDLKLRARRTGVACKRKSAYASEQVARHYGQSSLQRDPDGPSHLWAYGCCACRRWHLTHMPQSSVAITARELREGVH